MADEKEMSEKLDKFLDSVSNRLDAWDKERKADCAKMDAAIAKMDAWEEEKKADKAKRDAAEADKAKRDAEEAEEKKKADAAAEAEEKAKRDAAEKEEKEKADRAKADAARNAPNPELAARMAAIEANLPAILTPENRKLFTDCQVKANRVYQAFGDSGAPPPLMGESLDNYQRRLMRPYKDHSPQWKERDLSTVPAGMLDIAEERIYADAYEAALHPKDLPPGELIRRETRDEAGRIQAHYIGTDSRAPWEKFTNGGMTGRFIVPSSVRH
jgi:hypothetical protein